MANNFYVARPEIEGLTNYVGVIGSDHAYIHQGKAFTYAKSLDLASGASKTCILHTPATTVGKYIHWRPSKISTTNDEILFEFGEGATYTGGSDVTDQVYNRNRNLQSVIPTLSTLYDGTVTITDAGFILVPIAIGTSGTPQVRSGGDTGEENELLLLPDTDYMIRITNTGSTTTTISVQLFWYEEDGYDGR